MVKSLKVISTLGIILGIAYYALTPSRIREYEFYPNAQIIEVNETFFQVTEGDSYVISITRGRGSSKLTTAHGHWNTIYLVLDDKPKIGETQVVSRLYRSGYTRGAGLGVAPDQKEQIRVTPIKLSKTQAKFKITGVLQLRIWWDIHSADIEDDSEVGHYGSKKVQWRPHYKRFEFNSTYTLKPGVIRE